MDLSEILSNPLFVPLLVAVITILFNVVALYWLQTRQYKIEYIIRNVEKTYIPLIAELHERLEQFNNFLENPDDLHYSFEKLEEIKKSGLFEFIRSHDKKLFDSLIHFYIQIYPKFEELCKLQNTTKKSIRSDWIQHIKNVVEDKEAKEYAKTLIDNFFKPQMYIALLNINVKMEEISKKWNETLVDMTQIHNIYNPNVVSRNAKFPTFDVSQDEINKLLEIAQPKIQELLNFFGEIRVELQRDVINDLIPRLQKYISNPLSR